MNKQTKIVYKDNSEDGNIQEINCFAIVKMDVVSNFVVIDYVKDIKQLNEYREMGSMYYEGFSQLTVRNDLLLYSLEETCQDID